MRPSEANSNEPRRTLVMAVFGGAAVMFAFNIGGYDLWPADEPRYAEVAREMLLFGDFVLPRVNGEPYLEKPPLFFWLIAAVSAVTGEVTAWSARAPSVAAAMLTLAVTYRLALTMFDKRTALWSVIVLATTVRFWWQARTAQIDMVLTACMAAGLYALWRVYERKEMGAQAAGVGCLNLALLYGAIVFGLYAKGPPALVFPLLGAIAIFWGRPETRRRLHLVAGSLVAAGAVLGWLLAAYASIPAPGDAEMGPGANVFRQTIGRALLGVSKAEPPWYYLTRLPVDLLPWTLFVPWTALWAWRNRRDDGVRFLLAWTVPALVVFSLAIGKRAIYILPLYPAMGILIARSVIELAEQPGAAWRRRTALGWIGLLLVFGLIGLGAVGAAYFRPEMLPLEYAGTPLPGIALFFGAVVVAAVAAAAKLHPYSQYVSATLHFPAVMSVQFGVLGVLCVLLIFPVVNEYKSAKDFCAPLRELAEGDVEYRLYSAAFSREEFILYARHFHEPVLIEPVSLGLPLTRRESAAVQRALMNAAKAAAERVAVADIRRPTESELDALEGAVLAAIGTESDALSQEAHVEGKRIATAARAAYHDSLRAFLHEFRQPAPAFAFMEEEHWRWMIGLHPDLRNVHVAQYEAIGNRKVLLLANPQGMGLLSEATTAG